MKIELLCDKANDLGLALSEDSDQPRHCPVLLKSLLCSKWEA